MQAIAELLDLPALILICCLIIGYSLMRERFDWKQAGEDDGGKASFLRLAIPVALVVSSWLLIYVTMKIVGTSSTWVEALNALFWYYALYIVVFSGAKTADKLADALVAKFTKPAG